MPTELLTSKLFIPPLRLSLVPRPRLIDLLNESLRLKRRLTLVSAPAGFGKTTLVANWLKQVDLQAAWLSLDEADNDLQRFLAYLAAAFQRVDEEIGLPLLNALQSPQLPPVEKVLTGVLNEVAARADPLILVLDDCHLISEAAVLQVMEFLLQAQPTQLHLVVTTREDPELPLARLRARDQLTEIRARDLRFTLEESGIFFRAVMGLALSEQDVAVLEERTEGWAVGLQLAALSMQKQADPKAFIADFSGSQRHILDYLTDEVIHQQPEDIQHFLLQTAILDRLCGPLCNAVTGQNDGSALLAHLEAANLFVIPLDEERRWYRYHHLFSDLLRGQLARSMPELIPGLHRRASRWYEENGDIRAAIDHALQDSDLSRAFHLIEQSITMIYQGEVTTVLGWFDRLPEAILEPAPMLCVYKAWALALMRRGTRRGEVELALQAANQALERINAGQALRELVAGNAASIRAFVLRSPGLGDEKPEKLIALSQEAQRLLPEQEKAIRSVNALNIGYAYLALADLPAAQLAYQQTLEDGMAGGNLYAAIYGPINMVMIDLLAGRMREALQLCDTSIERFNRILAGQNFPPIGALDILKGSILVEFNRLAEAEPILLEGLDLIRWTGEVEAPITGFTALARLRAIQGNQRGMLEAIKALEEAWPEGIFYARALRHRLSLRHWPADPGVEKDAQGWLAQGGIEFETLPEIRSVDPMSSADFACCLNLTHVVARLAQRRPGVYLVENLQTCLERQQEFAAAHGFAGQAVEIAIARTLLYQASGRKDEALQMLEGGLKAAAPTGLLRVFVDECEPIQALLGELKPRLADETLAAYAGRLLEAFSCGPEKAESKEGETLLSGRELEVLQQLAGGLTYEEIGQQLFLSLNTVQFHVKNIYGKLLVNKRVQAIEKSREMNLI